MLKCPTCSRIIVDTTSNGGIKVRSRMIIFDESVAKAICPSCKTKVSVPLSVDTSKLPTSDKSTYYINQ